MAASTTSDNTTEKKAKQKRTRTVREPETTAQKMTRIENEIKGLEKQKRGIDLEIKKRQLDLEFLKENEEG